MFACCYKIFRSKYLSRLKCYWLNERIIETRRICVHIHTHKCAHVCYIHILCSLQPISHTHIFISFQLNFVLTMIVMTRWYFLWYDNMEFELSITWDLSFYLPRSLLSHFMSTLWQCVMCVSHDCSRSFAIFHLNVIHPPTPQFYEKTIHIRSICVYLFAGASAHQYWQCILDFIELWIDVTVESMRLYYWVLRICDGWKYIVLKKNSHKECFALCTPRKSSYTAAT